jgi:hypothetical protein
MCPAVLVATAVVAATTSDQFPTPTEFLLTPGEPSEEVHGFDLAGQLEEGPPPPVNGLTIRLAGKPMTRTNTELIQVRWTIRYTGPRPPIYIKRPDISRGFGEREAELMFFAVGKSGDAYGLGYRNLPDIFVVVPPLYRKEAFVFVPAGGSASGTFYIAVATLRDDLIRSKPDEFDRNRPPKLYAKLYLKSFDRGELDELDAWTGRVSSDIVPIPLTKW